MLPVAERLPDCFRRGLADLPSQRRCISGTMELVLVAGDATRFKEIEAKNEAEEGKRMVREDAIRGLLQKKEKEKRKKAEEDDGSPPPCS